MGDDRVYIYDAVYATQTLRVDFALAPDEGISLVRNPAEGEPAALSGFGRRGREPSCHRTRHGTFTMFSQARAVSALT